MEKTMRYIVDDHLISIGEYCYHRLLSWRSAHDDSGEVSATTVVLAAALIALALSVGVIVLARYGTRPTVSISVDSRCDDRTSR
ncbi:MAG: hypothetical protein ACKOYO_11410 [Actinomycetota bacterium]